MRFDRKPWTCSSGRLKNFARGVDAMQCARLEKVLERWIETRSNNRPHSSLKHARQCTRWITARGPVCWHFPSRVGCNVARRAYQSAWKHSQTCSLTGGSSPLLAGIDYVEVFLRSHLPVPRVLSKSGMVPRVLDFTLQAALRPEQSDRECI